MTSDYIFEEQSVEAGGWGEIKEVTEDHVRSAIEGYYLDLDLVIEDMKMNHHEWIARTYWARYRARLIET